MPVIKKDYKNSLLDCSIFFFGGPCLYLTNNPSLGSFSYLHYTPVLIIPILASYMNAFLPRCRVKKKNPLSASVYSRSLPGRTCLPSPQIPKFLFNPFSTVLVWLARITAPLSGLGQAKEEEMRIMRGIKEATRSWWGIERAK